MRICTFNPFTSDATINALRARIRKRGRTVMIIAIDFDGTCVTHEYPRVGRYIGAEPVLKELTEQGHKLILWTMRSNGRDDGTNPLQDAVDWFAERNIPLFGVNENPEQKTWTGSPKAYAHLYIDDAALGIPLCQGLSGERPYVNWDATRNELLNLGVIL